MFCALLASNVYMLHYPHISYFSIWSPCWTKPFCFYV